MAKILNFKTKQQPQDVIVLPHIFTKLLEMYKKYQNDVKNRKIEFLHKQAFQYFYEQLDLPEVKEDGVDIPAFLQKHNAMRKNLLLADSKASQVILQIITDDRVDECYSRRVKELKQMGIKF